MFRTTEKKTRSTRVVYLISLNLEKQARQEVSNLGQHNQP